MNIILDYDKDISGPQPKKEKALSEQNLPDDNEQITEHLKEYIEQLVKFAIE